MAERTEGDPKRTSHFPSVASPFRPDLIDESADVEAPKTPVHMTLDVSKKCPKKCPYSLDILII
jgi:hypothetical protein